MKFDLVKGDARTLAQAMAGATLWGAQDRRQKKRTLPNKEAIAEALCSEWLVGHERHLHLAHRAGYWHENHRMKKEREQRRNHG